MKLINQLQAVVNQANEIIKKVVVDQSSEPNPKFWTEEFAFDKEADELTEKFLNESPELIILVNDENETWYPLYVDGHEFKQMVHCISEQGDTHSFDVNYALDAHTLANLADWLNPNTEIETPAYIVAVTSHEDEMDYYYAFIDADAKEKAQERYNDFLQDDTTSIASLCLVIQSTDYSFKSQDVQPVQESSEVKDIDTEINLFDTVIVPDPDQTDIHQHSFEGFVTDIQDGIASVRDMEGDIFDIEVSRLTKETD